MRMNGVKKNEMNNFNSKLKYKYLFLNKVIECDAMI